jgi:hypothetical protein
MTSVCSEQNNVTWTARPQDELRNPIKHTDSVEKISTSLNQSQHVTGIKSQTDRRLSFICIFSICFMNSPWRWGGRFGTPSMVGVWFAKGERERGGGGDEVSRREARDIPAIFCAQEAMTKNPHRSLQNYHIPAPHSRETLLL